MRGIYLTGWTVWAGLFVCAGPSGTAPFVGINTNTQHNTYRDIHVFIPGHNGSGGFVFTGAGEPANTITCGTSNELWDQVSFLYSSATGASEYALYFQVCADILMRGVRLVNSDRNINGTDTLRSITYDFNLGASLYPCDNVIDGIDFQSSTPGIYTAGTPASTATNKIINIASHAGGLPPNPNLPNLAWGYSNASP